MADRMNARLAEERKRLGLTQTMLAANLGTSAHTQSLLETGGRALRADYLARACAAGINVHYVLTGERDSARILDPAASSLIEAYLRLPAALRSELVKLAARLCDTMPSGQARLAHRRRGYLRT